MHPSLQGPKWKYLRLSTFVATGFSAFAPIIHGATIFPYSQFEKQCGLRYYYLEGFLILAGVAFYAVWLLRSRLLLLHIPATLLTNMTDALSRVFKPQEVRLLGCLASDISCLHRFERDGSLLRYHDGF